MGSILVGIAVALVVGAYIARPFRVAGEGVEVERTIEGWVARVRAEGRRSPEAVNYCPQCGRRVGPDDRFCPGCGTRLR